jgi:DNA-binding response OmpR family regulator
MAASRILVVDDDDDIRGLLRALLERAGHEVLEAPDGRSGLRELFSGSPDLVILDVAMPGLDGWATLERIREVTDVPVLMLTARDAELERVRGLMGGADDYVVKPFGRQELVARVDVLLRRPRGDRAPETYADARLSISFGERSVRYDEREVALTRLEFRLLSALVGHPNQVLSHDQLLELVWDDTLRTSRDEVKLYVGYLRRKLAPDAPLSTPIETVRGFGYRYRPPN